MGPCHAFYGVGNELPGGKGIFHALMAHCDPVADTDGVEFQRGPAGGKNAVFYGSGDGLQVDVAGHYLIKGIHNAD